MKPRKTFRAILTTPCREDRPETYIVEAGDKTEARQEIRKLYRRDTPAPRHGFYSFDQCRLRWIEDAEEDY